MAILVDTGVLLALEDSSDRWHEGSLQLLETTDEPLGKFEFVPLTAVDLRRAREVMARYADARLDFADASLVAVAERLKLVKIATVDRRDFSLVQPAHCKHFDLLP